MTEYIEVRSVKPRRSHKHSQAVTTIQLPSDSSDDASNSDDEDETILVELPAKTTRKSRRHKSKQTLPIIVNTQPVKEKKRHHRKNVQQFLINAQPAVEPTVKKEIFIQPVIESTVNPEIQYVPIGSTTSALRYRTALEPTIVEERPITFYDPLIYPTRRRILTEPAESKTVHLPRHAQKLVNRFLSGMERAHGGHRHGCDSDSDCSIDDCHVCRRVRSVMDGRSRSTSVFHRHRHQHHYQHHHHRDRCDSPCYDPCRHCDTCNLLRKSDVVISHRADHSLGHSKRRHGRRVHVIETSPSRSGKHLTETKTMTTTTTKPNVMVQNVPVPPPPMPPSVPYQTSYYPMTYPSYTDPTHNANSMWPYYSSGTGANYDYSPYYTQPFYPQNYYPYPMPPATVTDPSSVYTRTTTVPVDDVVVEETRTHRRHKPGSQTLVIHRSAEQTVPDSKTVIERSHRSRKPRKVHATTMVKEPT